MICLVCARVREEGPGGACLECGAVLVPLSEPHLDHVVQGRLLRHIGQWQAEGLLSPGLADRLETAVRAPHVPTVSVVSVEVPPPPEPDAAQQVEAWAEGVAASLKRSEGWGLGWGAALARTLEEAAREEREQAARKAAARTAGEEGDGSEGDLGLALGAGSALYASGDSGALGGGLEAVVALDDLPVGRGGREEGAPRLHEYIWWFLGAVLVLGGSLMGVREAWRALGGAPRQLLVTGALLGYHAAFIGLGRFLGRRSLSAARILAGIGLALLPVVFVALAALVELSPGLGVAVALGCAGLALVPMRTAGRLLHGVSTASLAIALVPSLLAGLPLMRWGEAPVARALCACVGVGALAVTVWRERRRGLERASWVSVGAALYGAVCLGLFVVASAPSGFQALAPGGLLFANMTLWAMLLAAVVAVAASLESVRAAHPRAGPVFETLAHAGLASGALAGALGAFSCAAGADLRVDVASVMAPALAAAVYFLCEIRRRALIHAGVLAVLLTGGLAARLVTPWAVDGWLAGVGVAAAGLMLVARATSAQGPRVRLLTWSLVVSVAMVPAFAVLASGWDAVWFAPRWVTGLTIAGAAHAAGGWRWRGLHVVGAVALWLGVLAALSGEAAGPGVLVLLGAGYGLVGLVQAAWARRAVGSGHALVPLEDVSLGFSLAAVVGAVWGRGSGLPVVAAHLLPSWDALVACAVPGFAALVLFLRLRRDASRLVSFAAASALALAVSRGAGAALAAPRGVGEGLAGDDGVVGPGALSALIAAAMALAFALVAAGRGREAHAPGTPASKGRQVLGALPLPWGARGRMLLTDGFAAAAFIQAGLAALALLPWLLAPVAAERSTFLLTGGLLTVAALVAFVSRGFVSYAMRGSVATLAVVAGFMALTALVLRAGRPLPPDVVAWRQTLVGLGLWGVALATRRWGPALARRLENPTHGPLYHGVPHAGVAVLALVLLQTAARLSYPEPTRALALVPPLLLLGPAVLAMLLAVSFRAAGLARVSLWLGLPGAALWCAQGGVGGVPLMALDPPGGQWASALAVAASDGALGWLEPRAWLAPGATPAGLWLRALLGVSLAGGAYAVAAVVVAHVNSWRHALARLLAPRMVVLPGPILEVLREASLLAVVLVALAAFFQPGLGSAGVVFLTGAMLLWGQAPRAGRTVLGVGFILLVHAQAHRAEFFASWPGPVLVLMALAVVAGAPWRVRRRGLSESATRVRIQLSVLPFLGVAGVYALAAGGTPSPTFAVPQLLWEAVLSVLLGRWFPFIALPASLALLAVTVFVAARPWRGAFATGMAAVAAMVAGSAGVAAVTTFLTARLAALAPSSYLEWVAQRGAALSLAATVGVLALHVAHRLLRTRREDLSTGLGWGRDAGLLLMGFLLAGGAASGRASVDSLPLAMGAIGLAVGVALHCAWREHTGRHVYFVQTAVVGIYALVRHLYAPGLSPESDALFALLLGFVLVGVTVLARRAGVRPVAEATRRFAALLPVGMAWVLPGDATAHAALLAAGSGLLYAALGALERSRLFGAFAAAATNLSLLVGALAFGLEGLEIYLAPLGLLLLMLGQLFASSLPQAARNAVRVLGGLLLYVPAAARLSLSVGASPDGTAALVFGGVCLLGVVAGMALRIRAYLAMGTLFLTLDVAVNVLDAGLRDHRVGFLVMTLAGLTIVGGRVLATVRRQEWERWVLGMRARLSGWD
ncbi:hypothetical protein DRW03_03135 [Corallococcus sp. H22C18031201]|nr:hypothetical protein DRW03_03135 [Corallococcus sp. H22C18031201]